MFKMSNNRVFYGNVCLECQTSVASSAVVNCSGCGMAPYCGEAHKLRHEKKHKKLCTTLQQVLPMMPRGDMSLKANWYQFRTQAMMVTELLLGRKLLGHEMNMILFPRTCEVCHDKLNLTECEGCMCVGYCSIQHREMDKAFHSENCASFALCRELDLSSCQFQPEFEFSSRRPFALLSDINSFMNESIEVEKSDSDMEHRHKLVKLSESITCPLSLLYGLSLVDFVFKPKTVIHVLGSSELETHCLKSWGMILHCNPEVVDLTVVFIGPECSVDSRRRVENVSVEGCRMLYHEYVSTSRYTPPDVVCAFNCGLHEFEGSSNDTWLLTLPLLVRPGVPLVFTSFTETECEKDVARLTAVNVLSRKNPFASLRPFRDLENLGTYFNNHFLSVLTA